MTPTMETVKASGASRARRSARLFAAQMGLQAYAQLAAEGAVDAYGAITGETWKPCVAPPDNAEPLDQQAAAELEAFGS